MFQIERGEIHHEDYDIVVCTMDLINEVAAIRKILKDLYPNQKKGICVAIIAQDFTYLYFGPELLSFLPFDFVELLNSEKKIEKRKCPVICNKLN